VLVWDMNCAQLNLVLAVKRKIYSINQH